MRFMLWTLTIHVLDHRARLQLKATLQLHLPSTSSALKNVDWRSNAQKSDLNLKGSKVLRNRPPMTGRLEGSYDFNNYKSRPRAFFKPS